MVDVKISVTSCSCLMVAFSVDVPTLSPKGTRKEAEQNQGKACNTQVKKTFTVEPELPWFPIPWVFNQARYHLLVVEGMCIS